MSRDDLDKLCQQHAQALWCYLASRLPGGDPNGVGDVCQETWLKALRAREHFDGRCFKAWLFRIAHNTLMDELRRKKPAALPEDVAVADQQEPSPLEGLLDQERRAVVQECMKTLAAEEAAVVRSRAEGGSNEEIAHNMGLTRQQVYNLFFQAKAKLKTCVERKLP